jgi:hypothetical protein
MNILFKPTRASAMIAVALLSAHILVSCNPGAAPNYSNTPSFKLLQDKIITPVCSQCHTQQSTYAYESGLILDPAVAYENLVGAKSHDAYALADGLLRVKPGSADSSFLFMKLHGIPNGKDYGSQMPLGYLFLTIGQQKFIQEWINAGASKTAIVPACLPSLLDDTSRYPVLPFTALAPPPAGQGFQVTSGQFNVASNYEREIFVYRHLGNPQPILVNHIHTRMRPNSHHLVLYTFDPSTPFSYMPSFNAIRDLRDAAGNYNYSTETQMQWHIFLGGSMTPEGDYYFPQGVALPLPTNTGIDVNTHFIDYTNSPIIGECYANLYTADPGSVQHIATPIFNYTTNINLPPHQQTLVTDNSITNSTDTAVHVFMLTSHNHQWGQKFQIYITGGPRNGELVFENTDWAHPLIKSYDPPIVLNPGEGLRSVVTYLNTTDNTIQFGLKSTDEMDVIYGYFY